jgi:hypothetical protein
VLPTIEDGILCGDKAYCDGPLKERLAEDQNLDLLTPAREGQRSGDSLGGREAVSEAVSRIRQWQTSLPDIESLFNWTDEKTGIQRASKARSYQGLLVHTFGRLAAAMLLLALNPWFAYQV